jgi:hypothetical protein
MGGGNPDAGGTTACMTDLGCVVAASDGRAIIGTGPSGIYVWCVSDLDGG